MPLNERTNRLLWMVLLGFLATWNTSVAQCISGDCLEGEGLFIYPDESIYIGAFRDGRASGKGACYYHSGAYYEGQFWAHNYQGIGALYTLDRQLKYGLWDNGQLSQPLAPTPPSQRPPRVWVLAIGINDYPQLTPLLYAEQDAQRYANLHRTFNQLSDTKHIELLAGDQATRANIVQTLHDMGQRMQPQDWFFFYYSGHGIARGIVPYDGDASDSLSLTYEQLHHLLTHTQAQQVFAVVDACHSGQLSQDIQQLYRGPSAYRSPLAHIHRSKVNYLLSSTAEQFSLEDNNLHMSVQTHFIIKGLSGAADDNHDGDINVAEIMTYVKREVTHYSGQIQTPVAILGEPTLPMSVVRLFPK